MNASLMARSNKTGDSSQFSLNVVLVHLLLLLMQKSGFQGMLQASYKIFWWPCKEIVTVVLAKIQDVVKAIEKKSIQMGKTVHKSCPSVAFSMVSQSLSQLSDILNWRV